MDRGGCLATLGLGHDASWEDARDSYRRLAARTHPDHGGSPAVFDAVRRAWAALAPTLPHRAAPAPRPVEATAVAPSAPVRIADGHRPDAATAPRPRTVDAIGDLGPVHRRVAAAYASAPAAGATAAPGRRRHRPCPAASRPTPFADLLARALARTA